MKDRRDKSRIQWQGKSWRLRVLEVKSGDGRTVEDGYIEHPGSVVLVPMQGERVLMLRQYRFALGETILELPAGTRERDESWEQCAQRELREETGYRAESLTSLGLVWPAPGITNELMAVYLATDLSPAPLEADADEQIEVVPRPLSELVDMALGGQLQDAKSIVALVRTASNLGVLK